MFAIARKGDLGRAVAIVACALALGGLAASAVASPSLAVTKPPVGPAETWTGPAEDPCQPMYPEDPHAAQGQWFLDVDAMLFTALPNEFHDNRQGEGGSPRYFSETVFPFNPPYGHVKCIYGKALNVVKGPGAGNIMSFDIRATITNDTFRGMGQWADGTNSHYESRSTSDNYQGTLFGTKLTADFAVPSANFVEFGWTGPYRETTPLIVAMNHDSLAWYCWTNTPPRPDDVHPDDPDGGFIVPAWDFGNIEEDEYSTRILSFTVTGTGLPPTDGRYTAILESEAAEPSWGDLFANRSSSLKISDWVDDLLPDSGLRGSSVSVFHGVPEPASLSLIALGATALLARRRRRR